MAHHSPTNTTISPCVPPHQPHHHHQSVPSTATTSWPQAAGPAQAQSQSPISSGRQDSFFPRFDIVKDIQLITTSPHPHPTSNGSQVAISPRPNSSPTSTTLPDSGPNQPHAKQGTSNSKGQAQTQTSRRTNCRPVSSNSSYPIASSKTVEHTSALAPLQPASKSMQEPVTLEPSNRTQTRQQRYSVRFAPNYSATNYTAANMASANKPRPSPPVMPVSPASPVETVESPKPLEQPSTGPIEQSLVTRNDIRNMTEPVQDQPQQQGRSPSVERCIGCHEAWKRPLPELQKSTGMPITKTNNDLAISNISIIDQLRAHGRNVEIMHDKWRERHYHCVPRESLEPPLKPDTEDARSTASNTTSREGKPAQIVPGKRRLEPSPEDEQPNNNNNNKSRKITFEGA